MYSPLSYWSFLNALISVARNEESAGKAVQDLESQFNVTNCRPFQLDIKDEMSIAKIKTFLEKEHDGFDILINNAGVICTV